MMSLGLFLDPVLAQTPYTEYRMPDDYLLPPQPELLIDDTESTPLVLDPNGRDPTQPPNIVPSVDPTHGIAPRAELPKVLPEKISTPAEVRPAKLVKKPGLKRRKAKIVKAKPNKKVLNDETTVGFTDDEYVDSEREPADTNGDIRTFKDTIRSIVDFNNQWEVNFTDNGRYRILGQPSEIYDYQRTGQYLEIKAHEGERRIMTLQPIRVRFRPVR